MNLSARKSLCTHYHNEDTKQAHPEEILMLAVLSEAQPAPLHPETIPFTTAPLKRIKHPGINVPEEVKELYSDTCKTLIKLKTIQKDMLSSWVGKINIVKMTNTIQGNLQIQYMSYQITNGTFHKTRTKFFNFYGNT